jgi:hypothetical protein
MVVLSQEIPEESITGFTITSNVTGSKPFSSSFGTAVSVVVLGAADTELEDVGTEAALSAG